MMNKRLIAAGAVLATVAALTVAVWAQSIPGVTVFDTIVPSSTNDTYPTHESQYGKGGLRTVATTNALALIPSARREVGMLVYVTNSGNYYQLASDLSTWGVAQFEAGVPADGDKGDITVSGGVWTIDDGVVTTGKLASSTVDWVESHLTEDEASALYLSSPSQGITNAGNLIQNGPVTFATTGSVGVASVDSGGMTFDSGRGITLNGLTRTNWPALSVAQYVNTVADMLAMNPADVADGSIVVTLGRDAAGDGGGLAFKYSSASTASTNIGTVWEFDTGRLEAVNHDGDVRVFGAKGDNATDDTLAVQSAIDESIASGIPVKFPPGTYLLQPGAWGSHVLTLGYSDYTQAAGVTSSTYTTGRQDVVNLGSLTLEGVLGDKRPALIDASPPEFNQHGVVLHFTNCVSTNIGLLSGAWQRNLTLKNLTIVGEGYDDGATAFQFQRGSSHLLVDNVDFQHWGTAIDIGGDSTVTDAHSDFNYIRRVLIDDCEYGIKWGAQNSYVSTLEHCAITARVPISCTLSETSASLNPPVQMFGGFLSPLGHLGAVKIDGTLAADVTSGAASIFVTNLVKTTKALSASRVLSTNIVAGAFTDITTNMYVIVQTDETVANGTAYPDDWGIVHRISSVDTGTGEVTLESTVPMRRAISAGETLVIGLPAIAVLGNGVQLNGVHIEQPKAHDYGFGPVIVLQEGFNGWVTINNCQVNLKQYDTTWNRLWPKFIQLGRYSRYGLQLSVETSRLRLSFPKVMVDDNHQSYFSHNAWTHRPLILNRSGTIANSTVMDEDVWTQSFRSEYENDAAGWRQTRPPRGRMRSFSTKAGFIQFERVEDGLPSYGASGEQLKVVYQPDPVTGADGFQENGMWMVRSLGRGTNYVEGVYDANPIDEQEIATLSILSVPSDGDTITLNRDVRTWTTNSSQLATNKSLALIGADAATSATNFYLSLVTNDFSNVTPTVAGTNVTLTGDPGLRMTVTTAGSWPSLAYVTNDVGLVKFTMTSGSHTATASSLTNLYIGRVVSVTGAGSGAGGTNLLARIEDFIVNSDGSVLQVILSKAAEASVTNADVDDVDPQWIQMTHPSWYSSSAPTTGEWWKGDIIYNTAVGTTNNVGWVCTASGIPGTWREFGAIERGQITVGTVAEMLALGTADVANGSVVTTLGRDAAGDGGGLMFRYDASSTSSTNTGTVWAFDTGRFEAVEYDGNVLAFGAVGDGTTDDTAAIQAAIEAAARVVVHHVDSAYTNGLGGPVFLPGAREYLVSGLDLRRGIDLFGSTPAGKLFPVDTTATRLKLKAGSSRSILNAAAYTNWQGDWDIPRHVTIRNLVLDGNYENQTTNNYLLNGIHIEGVEAKTWTIDAITVMDTVGWSVMSVAGLGASTIMDSQFLGGFGGWMIADLKMVECDIAGRARGLASIAGQDVQEFPVGWFGDYFTKNQVSMVNAYGGPRSATGYRNSLLRWTLSSVDTANDLITLSNTNGLQTGMPVVYRDGTIGPLDTNLTYLVTMVSNKVKLSTIPQWVADPRSYVDITNSTVGSSFLAFGDATQFLMNGGSSMAQNTFHQVRLEDSYSDLLQMYGVSQNMISDAMFGYSYTNTGRFIRIMGGATGNRFNGGQASWAYPNNGGLQPDVIIEVHDGSTDNSGHGMVVGGASVANIDDQSTSGIANEWDYQEPYQKRMAGTDYLFEFRDTDGGTTNRWLWNGDSWYFADDVAKASIPSGFSFGYIGGTAERLENHGTVAPEFAFYGYSPSSRAGTLSFYTTAGTRASQAATTARDLGNIFFLGHDGSSLVGAKAAVQGYATENWSTTNTPADVVISATPSGSTTRTNVLRVTGTNVVVTPNKGISLGGVNWTNWPNVFDDITVNSGKGITLGGVKKTNWLDVFDPTDSMTFDGVNEFTDTNTFSGELVASAGVTIGTNRITQTTDIFNTNTSYGMANKMTFSSNAVFNGQVTIGTNIVGREASTGILYAGTLDKDADDVYGELYAHTNATSQTLTLASTYYLADYPDEIGNTNNVTVSGNRITVLRSGLYEVRSAITFSGTASATFEMAVFTNATECENIQGRRKLGTGGDIGSLAISGLLSLSSNDVVDVRYSSSSGAGNALTVAYGNFNLIKR